MQIRIDSSDFDRRQIKLIEIIARETKEAFESIGVSGERLRKAVEQLAFSIAAILDASVIMELDGKPLLPSKRSPMTKSTK